MSIDLTKPLDLGTRNPEIDAMLADLQANILKPHGRKVAAHQFIRFRADKLGEARSIVRRIGAATTSAQAQLDQAKRFRESNGTVSGDPVICFWLSAEGYTHLQLEPLPQDVAFLAGMANRGSELNDHPEVSPWEGHLVRPHAVLLIAGDDETTVQDKRRELIPDNAPSIESSRVELGMKLGDRGADREPFGFREGISNPEILGNSNGWDPTDAKSTLFPLTQALVPYPAPSSAGFGSFFVLRKLQQHVGRFNQLVDALAQQLGSIDDRELAAAMIIGRFRDGTLLAKHRNPVPGPTEISFTYDELDRLGLRCPFHAHIRKANPRGEAANRTGSPVSIERSRLILRRGIPYRQVTERGEKVGTLFICCQSSIERQFEHVQHYWINGAGMAQQQDALAGQLPRESQTWIKDGERAVAFVFESCVTLKGGEYFFAAPRSFLQQV
jgi:Dyp-type peroxidase family